MASFKKILSFAAAVSACVSAAIQGVCAEGGARCSAENIEIKSGADTLSLSPKNGAVVGLRRASAELLAKSERAFVLRFLKRDGSFVSVDDSAFAKFSFGGNRAKWTECAAVNGLEFSVEVKSANGEFRFRPRVDGIPDGFLLDYIESPRVCVPLKNELLSPWSEGMLVLEREKRNRKRLHLEFPDKLRTGYFPGICQMQFMASYSGKGGVYFAADDYASSTKVLEFAQDAPEVVGLRIESACGTESPSSTYVQPFDIVLRTFEGDWTAACEIYRQWVKNDPSMKSPIPHPKWLDESPVTIIYPVCGDRAVSAKPNKFIPYENAFPRVMELAKGFDSKVMALLMRWDHNGPWLPPYYWPPVGGEQSLRKYRDLLHGEGHLIGLYGSGTAYTMTSKFNSYSGVERYKKEALGGLMVRGPKGERAQGNCTYIRESEAFCVAQKRSREILERELMIQAREKIDFAQFFDQNMGCTSPICYAADHGHPAVPGAWQTKAMRDFLDELNAKIRASGSEMILGTEGAAAGPYVSALPFNDMRDTCVRLSGEPVPAYQYVYHVYINNFMGNQCNDWWNIKHDKCPDNLQFRIAQAFSAGEMLTVVLRDDGSIDWCAAADWNVAPPAQEPVIALIKNLNAARKKYPQYLMRGEMVKPPLEVECGKYTIHYRDRIGEYPEISTSAWRETNGKIMQFFVNFRAQPVKCRIGGEEVEIAPLSVIQREF